MPTAVRKLEDQRSTGPSGVAAQSRARHRAAISPSPMKTVPRDRGASALVMRNHAISRTCVATGGNLPSGGLTASEGQANGKRRAALRQGAHAA